MSKAGFEHAHLAGCGEAMELDAALDRVLIAGIRDSTREPPPRVPPVHCGRFRFLPVDVSR